MRSLSTCSLRQKKKKINPCFHVQRLTVRLIRKNYKKNIKRQVTHKILIMFYHLTTIKIRIIKKFHIKRTVKVGHENSGFAFF